MKMCLASICELTSKDIDQPAKLRSLIRVCYMKISCPSVTL